jgi:retinal rod rhodopsin-sensitive cGMP 3',5'-cyclic phosphodiesterase subunit delta
VRARGADQQPAPAAAATPPVSEPPHVRTAHSNYMKMGDAETGDVLWEQTNWCGVGVRRRPARVDHARPPVPCPLFPAFLHRPRSMFERVLEAHIPARVLSCRAVFRELSFSSVELMHKFRMRQRVLLRGTCIEAWDFDVGFVIPGSTNTWEQVIEAAPPEQMLPAAVLSGNVEIETSFIDGELIVAKGLVRVYYDEV